jgi:hypothetical protein
VPIRIVGGTKTVRLERPRGVPVQLKIVGSTGSAILDGTRLGKKGGASTIESPGWGASSDRIAMEVVGGSKSIEIVDRP